MAISRSDVVNYLDREEPPYYAAAAALGEESLPILAELVRGDDLGLAAKAASLAGHIRGGAFVLGEALTHEHPAVRVSAAAAIQFIDEASQPLLERALGDPSPLVRKWALRSTDIRRPRDIRAALERLALSDSDDRLRERASQILNRLD